VRLGLTRDNSASPDLKGLTGGVLDRRLLAGSPRPVAVALSGGGDSLALLLLTRAWAKRASRKLLVLTVDHALQPESGAWTEACSATAARLGLPFQALAWTGAKPSTGLSAAARQARHRLLAQAARRAGARVILMGHTADDILEARLMRARGSTTPDPREWSPSPAWPEGRGVFLLRPLLGLRRAAIRDWLAGQGETWIDDPANASPTSARANARRDIVLGAPGPAPDRDEAPARGLALACQMDGHGILTIGRQALLAEPSDTVVRFLSAACLCAAGTDRPPARARVVRLAERLRGRQAFAATLAGARIEADDGQIRILREAGEAARGGLRPLTLAAGETGVWDGRFEITADRPMQIVSSAGLRSQLSPADQQTLMALPARARDGLPVVPNGPKLAVARPLSLERLLAACGAVAREPA
jgi:tRNA(Ile)-lysidine synthase